MVTFGDGPEIFRRDSNPGSNRGWPNNYADFFTKPLKSKVFFGLRNKIMNIA